MSLSLCAISYCKQDISRTNLWIFAKFIAVTPYTLPWKWLIFGADYIQKMAENEWPKICSFHTGYFLSGVNSALWRITLYWLSNMAVDKHHSACSSSCFLLLSHLTHFCDFISTSCSSYHHYQLGVDVYIIIINIIIRPRHSRSAAAYSHQTFPWTICRSVGPYIRASVDLSVCLSTFQYVVEKRQIRSGCHLAS